MSDITIGRFPRFTATPRRALRLGHNLSISALRAAPERSERTHRQTPLALLDLGKRAQRNQKTEQNEATATHLHTPSSPPIRVHLRASAVPNRLLPKAETPPASAGGAPIPLALLRSLFLRQRRCLDPVHLRCPQVAADVVARTQPVRRHRAPGVALA